MEPKVEPQPRDRRTRENAQKKKDFDSAWLGNSVAIPLVKLSPLAKCAKCYMNRLFQRGSLFNETRGRRKSRLRSWHELKGSRCTIELWRPCPGQTIGWLLNNHAPAYRHNLSRLPGCLPT